MEERRASAADRGWSLCGVSAVVNAAEPSGVHDEHPPCSGATRAGHVGPRQQGVHDLTQPDRIASNAVDWLTAHLLGTDNTS